MVVLYGSQAFPHYRNLMMMYSTIDEKGMLLNIHESHFWWYFQVLLMIAKNMWESPNAILKKHKTSPGTYDRLVISSPNARSLCHWKHSHEADPRAPKDRPPGWWWKSPSPVATRHSLQHTRDDLPSTGGSKDIQIGIQLILECVGNIVGISWNPMKTCPLKNGIPTYSKHIGHLKALGFSGSREDEPLPRWGHPKSPARIAGVSYLFRRMERWLIEWERVIILTHAWNDVKKLCLIPKQHWKQVSHPFPHETPQEVTSFHATTHASNKGSQVWQTDLRHSLQRKLETSAANLARPWNAQHFQSKQKQTTMASASRFKKSCKTRSGFLSRGFKSEM